jgi:hypothetical protein
MVIVLNFDDTDHVTDIPFPTSGRWSDLLADFDGIGGPFTLDVDAPRATVTVGSHWGRVLCRVNPGPTPNL